MMTKQEQDARVIKIMNKTINQIDSCIEHYQLESITSTHAIDKIESILKDYDKDLNNLLEEIIKSEKEEVC